MSAANKAGDHTDEQRERVLSTAIVDIAPCGSVNVVGSLLSVAALTMRGGDRLVRLTTRRAGERGEGDKIASARLGEGTFVMLIRSLIRAASVAGFDISPVDLMPRPETIPLVGELPRDVQTVIATALDDRAEVRLRVRNKRREEEVVFGVPVDADRVSFTLRLRGGRMARFESPAIVAVERWS
jgi:hypothetical protein